MNYQEKISLRKWSNIKILDKLKLMVEKYPELRFGQILHILNIADKDIWNEESIDTLKNISNKKI